MDPLTAYEIRHSVQFVDVRTDLEWDAGRISGARHIPLQDLAALYEELSRQRPVVAVCQVGQRSGLAAVFLNEKGFDAHNLEGGLEAWITSGLPLEGRDGLGRVVDGRANTFEG
jgi:rhodanese-related sulfurtransferase